MTPVTLPPPLFHVGEYGDQPGGPSCTDALRKFHSHHPVLDIQTGPTPELQPAGVMFGFCACGEPLPCGCARQLYGRFGMTRYTPGHPGSGKCRGCEQDTADAVRVGKFIYCRGHAPAAPLGGGGLR